MPSVLAQRSEQRSMPLQTRLVPVSSVDEKARTFETVWTTGAQVRRFDWGTWSYYLEELSLDPAHIRLERFNGGAPLLNTHQQWDLDSVLGVTERAWLEPTEGRSVCRFSDRDERMNAYWRDVVNGIIRNISVGYIVHRYQKTDPAEPGGLPVWVAIDWEPAEQSLVPVGADALSGVRSLTQAGAPQDPKEVIDALARGVGHRTFPCEIVTRAAQPSPQTSAAAAAEPTTEEEHPMPKAEERAAAPAGAENPTELPAGNPAPAQTGTRTEADILVAERQRTTQIRTAVAAFRRTAHGELVTEADVNGMIERGLTLDQARSEMFAKLEERSNSQGPTRGAANIRTEQDEQHQRRADMESAMSHRANPGVVQLPETARRFRGMTLFELARRSLELQGQNTEGMGRNEVVALAMGNADVGGFRSMHGTSDFSIALANTVGRSLRQAYSSAPQTFRPWARKGTLTDFRAATRMAVAGNLKLEKVNEFGEFKRGKIVDAGETIQLASYGKVVGVTRQVVINDDLDFLSRLPAMFGRAAADFESDTVYSILKGNPAMADGTALFHANHGNLGTAGAISETTLNEARKAMRLQKDPSGNNQPMNIVGKYVIVGATKETEAQKNFQAVVIAGKATDTNVFQNAYEIIVEPRLDASLPFEWFLVADPSQIDTIEYSYLDGDEGLYTEQRMGFDVDGIEVKGRLDFAAKAIDWRGMFKNPATS